MNNPKEPEIVREKLSQKDKFGYEVGPSTNKKVIYDVSDKSDLEIIATGRFGSFNVKRLNKCARKSVKPPEITSFQPALVDDEEPTPNSEFSEDDAIFEFTDIDGCNGTCCCCKDCQELKQLAKTMSEELDKKKTGDKVVENMLQDRIKRMGEINKDLTRKLNASLKLNAEKQRIIRDFEKHFSKTNSAMRDIKKIVEDLEDSKTTELPKNNVVFKPATLNLKPYRIGYDVPRTFLYDD